ncbi:hypothetical protein [Cellulomonas denverensis]|uniref:Secreted protein n=1 Tax=Cellulomonas denverensis TaxID=264297 RepID=A0A7X6KWL6_9CELL|nr:hypothetical protein [Cellulomonas denverensis]NKY23616.1 hypothetical protein [Cellulomonas denverensis]
MWAAVVVAASAVLAAGCAVQATPTVTAVPSAVPSTARAITGPDCLAPQVLADLGFDPGDRGSGSVHADAPAAGPVPEGFAPVLVVECSTGELLTDEDGQWEAVTATRREGDLEPLVEALSGDRTAAPGTGCAPEVQQTELWLVDSMGDAVRAAVPGSVCGRLPSRVRAELDRLDAVDVEAYPVRLAVPRSDGS